LLSWHVLVGGSWEWNRLDFTESIVCNISRKNKMNAKQHIHLHVVP
jgi:hypothetical protein